MADPAIVSGQSPAPASVVSALAPVAPAAVDPSPAPAPSSAAADPASAGAPSWFEGLPEGLRTHPSLQAFKSKDFSAVAESLVNAEKLVGGSLRLPTDKDTPAERAAKLDKVFTQLGRPEKAEGYVITKPADLDIPWDQAKADGFKEVAHKLGLTQAQVEGLSAYDVQRALSTQVDSTAAFNTCMEALDKDWGAAKNTMLGLSRRTAATYFDPDTLAAINATGLANNPKFVKALAQMGKGLVEEGLIVGGREGMGEDGGISALQSELDKTMQDSKSAYWNSADPGHAAAVIRMHSLRAALLELAPTPAG